MPSVLRSGYKKKPENNWRDLRKPSNLSSQFFYRDFSALGAGAAGNHFLACNQAKHKEFKAFSYSGSYSGWSPGVSPGVRNDREYKGLTQTQSGLSPGGRISYSSEELRGH